ncbi:PQQ-dependent sugar dehydrogenase [Gangjinia marincola]|uniref:PQQ-dependent sugar dehydrogenase n=1 Tax=Gangjinia marincola TaxID=578463 RepID=A0ABP3XQN4_9FLAO
MKKTLIMLGLTCGLMQAQQQLNLEEVATGFSQPLDIQHANDDRLFIVEKQGLIKILQPDGTTLPNPFLDLSNQITTNSERGVLGLAFHPDYTTNGFFYVHYSDADGDTVISRFSVSGDANVADPTSETILLQIDQPFANHNGGTIAFGPDGKLFYGSGDGGSGGDPGDRAQDPLNLLGKMLRLDVDIPAPYIPADNPFVDDDNVADEIWSIGVRNPFRFSFDEPTGTLWIADVGQNAFEEINRVSASAEAINYGWRCYEGNAVFNQSGDCPEDDDLTFPLVDYAHINGGRSSVTGGMVYRGTEFPDLVGKYIFADYVSDELGIIDENDNLMWDSTYPGNGFAGFGEDNQQNLYVAALSGRIFKVVSTNLSTADNSATAFSMFPNPAQEEFTLSGIESPFTVIIRDITGAMIYHNDQSEANVKLNTQSAGLYFVTVETKQGTFTQKLIKN